MHTFSFFLLRFILSVSIYFSLMYTVTHARLNSNKITGRGVERRKIVFRGLDLEARFLDSFSYDECNHTDIWQ